MDFKVIFRDTFLDDLERLVRRIAVHNPGAALKLGELIVQKGESLSFFPERYPMVRERSGIRRFIAKKHFKVFYRVHHEPRVVEVLRCWDARQQAEPYLGRGDY